MATESNADDFEFISFIQTQTRLDTGNVKALLNRLHNEGKIATPDYVACFKDINMSMMKTTRKDPRAKRKFTPPDLSNATITGLVDMLGHVREQIAVAKKEEGYYKERLMAELIAAKRAEPSEAPAWGGNSEWNDDGE